MDQCRLNERSDVCQELENDYENPSIAGDEESVILSGNHLSHLPISLFSKLHIQSLDLANNELYRASQFHDQSHYQLTEKGTNAIFWADSRRRLNPDSSLESTATTIESGYLRRENNSEPNPSLKSSKVEQVEHLEGVIRQKGNQKSVKYRCLGRKHLDNDCTKNYCDERYRSESELSTINTQISEADLFPTDSSSKDSSSLRRNCQRLNSISNHNHSASIRSKNLAKAKSNTSLNKQPFTPNIKLSQSCLSILNSLTKRDVDNTNATLSGEENSKRIILNHRFSKHISSNLSQASKETERNSRTLSFCEVQYTGRLKDLRYFQNLKELSLAENRLREFPVSLLELPLVTSLNLECNLIPIIPTFKGFLKRLEILKLSRNELATASFEELGSLKYLDVSLNQLKRPPRQPNKGINFVNLSGNLIWAFEKTMHENDESIKKASEAGEKVPVEINLSRNRLTGGVTLASLQHVTDLDVSENGITCLEVSSLVSLESLTCSWNSIVTLSVHGALLKHLVADNNRLTSLNVKCHPRRLRFFNVSRNNLKSLPPWMVSCNEIFNIDVSHNQLSSLPSYLTSGHLSQLTILSAHHNQLHCLPEPGFLTGSKQRQSSSQIEMLLLHSNDIVKLPANFYHNYPRLRILNVSSNMLSSLEDGKSFPRDRRPPLQELYAAYNQIQDLNVMEQCLSLRIIHVPYNRITQVAGRLFSNWELLEHLVMSGNCLQNLPSELCKLLRLKVLRVHMNPLTDLPKLSHILALKVIDASHCNLGRIDFDKLVGPSLSTLDLAANPDLAVDQRQFSKCKSNRQVKVVNTIDLSKSPIEETAIVRNKANKNEVFRDQQTNEVKIPWKIGFAESVGSSNELTIGQLRMTNLRDSGKASLVVMSESEGNQLVVTSFLTLLPKFIVKRDIYNTVPDEMKHNLITCLRETYAMHKSIPDSVFVASIELHENRTCHMDGAIYAISSKRKGTRLKICSMGDISCVVTLANSLPIVIPTPLQKNIKRSKHNERISIYSHSNYSSHLLIDPQSTVLRVEPYHRHLIVAPSSVWSFVDYEEASNICKATINPSIAAKRISTLAQSYGSKMSVSVIVINLSENTFESSNYSPPHLISTRHCNNMENCISFETIAATSDFNSEDDLQRCSPIGQSSSDASDTMSDCSFKMADKKVTTIPKLYRSSSRNKIDTGTADYQQTDRVWMEDKFLNGLAEFISPPRGFADSDSEDSSGDSGFSCYSEKNRSDEKHGSDCKPVNNYQKPWWSKGDGKVKFKKSQTKINMASAKSTPNLCLPENNKNSFGMMKFSHSPQTKLFSKNKNKTIPNRHNTKQQHFPFLRLGSGPFRRFGSLQNLKNYKNNKIPRTMSHINQELPQRIEMQEKTTTGRELDSRMSQYWDTGVTCF